MVQFGCGSWLSVKSVLKKIKEKKSLHDTFLSPHPQTRTHTHTLHMHALGRSLRHQLPLVSGTSVLASACYLRAACQGLLGPAPPLTWKLTLVHRTCLSAQMQCKQRYTPKRGNRSPSMQIPAEAVHSNPKPWAYCSEDQPHLCPFWICCPTADLTVCNNNSRLNSFLNAASGILKKSRRCATKGSGWIKQCFCLINSFFKRILSQSNSHFLHFVQRNNILLCLLVLHLPTWYLLCTAEKLVGNAGKPTHTKKTRIFHHSSPNLKLSSKLSLLQIMAFDQKRSPTPIMLCSLTDLLTSFDTLK